MDIPYNMHFTVSDQLFDTGLSISALLPEFSLTST